MTLGGGAALSLGVVTQMTARHLGYHPALGTALTVWSVRLYPPWNYVRWYATWATLQTPWGMGIRQGLPWLVGGLCLTALAALAVRWLAGGKKTAPISFGSARWATHEEMRDAGVIKRR